MLAVVRFLFVFLLDHHAYSLRKTLQQTHCSSSFLLLMKAELWLPKRLRHTFDCICYGRNLHQYSSSTHLFFVYQSWLVVILEMELRYCTGRLSSRSATNIDFSMNRVYRFSQVSAIKFYRSNLQEAGCVHSFRRLLLTKELSRTRERAALCSSQTDWPTGDWPYRKVVFCGRKSGYTWRALIHPKKLRELGLLAKACSLQVLHSFSNRVLSASETGLFNKGLDYWFFSTKVHSNGAQPAAVWPHAAFDNKICGRPHVIWNIRFGGCAGVCWSKTNPRQEN